MVINNYRELRETIKKDCRIYYNQPKHKWLLKKLLGHSDASMCKFIISMRKEAFYKYRRGLFNKCAYLFYLKRENKYGQLLGIEMHGECVGAGIIIRHYGSIVVNSKAMIGENCTFRGNNCVGVARDGGKPPIIGNNVDLGFGAVVIGAIELADNITVGANSVVLSSCLETGAILVGSPARIVGHNNHLCKPVINKYSTGDKI